MKLLVLCPGKIPTSTDDIRCFTDVINFYLPKALAEISQTTVVKIPFEDGEILKNIFNNLETNDYSAIITLGLRYYSNISKSTVEILRSKFDGLICQLYDGSRLNHDPVDITFTFKNDYQRMSKNPAWLSKHLQFNEYIGWAADPELNYPNQSKEELRILIDHTNYGDNPTDFTNEVLKEVKKFVDSNIWKFKYKSVKIRRFDSGKIVDVDLKNLSYEKYDRSKTIPYSEITKEHSQAHVFCVTHPESLGLVVLETALAGAFIVVPNNCVPEDRLNTVRHYKWDSFIDWNNVLNSINIEESRKIAIENSWKKMAENIINSIKNKNNGI